MKCERGLPTRPIRSSAHSDYVELHCHSVFSLLDGASQPEVLIHRALELGYSALALTDHDDLGGAVRFARAGADLGIEAILGAEVTVEVVPSVSSAPAALPTHLTLLAETREGYGNLCTLITRARMDRRRGLPSVSLDILAAYAGGLYVLTGCPRGWVPGRLSLGDVHGARDAAAVLLEIFDRRIAIECWDHFLPEEREIVRELLPIARSLGVPWVVTNDVHYAHPEGRMVHDVLSCLRHQRTLDEMGTRLRPNDEWHLKSASQMLRRWRHHPEGIRASREIAERCQFRLGQLRPSLPAFPLPAGETGDEYLAHLVHQGAIERWGDQRTETHDRQLAHELGMIRRLGFAGFFLIVWDIVRFARREGILCQGRGSAANSAVCYCLGITPIDPIKMNLLFERFLSEERQEAPDIDLDFAHQERERVIQYVYDRYGREHAAMVCEQITYRGRSAVRDVARVLGFSVSQADALAQFSDRFSAKATAEALRGRVDERGSQRDRWLDRYASETHVERRNPTTAVRPCGEERAAGTIVAQVGLDAADHRVQRLADIVEGLHQAPRHRSIHVGGFVLTKEPLSTVVPIEPASMPDRTVIQWEKDDLDDVGLVKIDVLGLGMLTVLQNCLKYIRRTRGVGLEIAGLHMDDPDVYDDLCRADTVGLFQVESRAQMNTLPRLKPRCFYDLVVEVALIRPGPIQGDMVHPYLRRRAGVEPITYPHPMLEPILQRTLGVPLFQEQGMQVAITAAGFSPGQADNLRRAMGHKRSRERMAAIGEELISGMHRNGIPAETARRIYNQINAFADYGFPESHAASFAVLVYASAYLKHYYPPEYTAAILNAQPMGFYSPGTLVEDARRHGVEVRSIDLMRSEWDASLEGWADGQMDRWAEGERGGNDGGDGQAGEDRQARISAVEERGCTAPCPLERNQGTAQPPSRPSAHLPAVRLGLRFIRGLGAKARDKLERAVREGPFTSVKDVVLRSSLDRRSLRCLTEAGAFDSFFLEEPNLKRRRAALWSVLEAERGDAGPLAVNHSCPAAHPPSCPSAISPMSPFELTEADYRMTSLSLNGHPLHHLRSELAPLGVKTARETRALPDGSRIVVAGLVICRQRPGTAKGFVFLTLEDETGTINVVVTPKRFERQALLISTTPLLMIYGTLQVESQVVNVRGERFEELRARVGAEYAQRHDFH